MPSIDFPFSLLCYMEYFSFLVVDEFIVTVSVLSGYICLQVTTFCSNVFYKDIKALIKLNNFSMQAFKKFCLHFSSLMNILPYLEGKIIEVHL